MSHSHSKAMECINTILSQIPPTSSLLMNKTNPGAIINEPKVPQSFTALSGPISLSNGNFLLHHPVKLNFVYVFLGQKKIWIRAVWDDMTTCKEFANLCTKTEFGGAVDGQSKNKNIAQFWILVTAIIVNPSILIFELNLETAKITLKTQFSLATEITNVIAVYSINHQFHFLFHYDYPPIHHGHMIYDTRIRKIVYDKNKTSDDGGKLMKTFKDDSYIHQNKCMITFSYDGALYLWKYLNFEWEKLMETNKTKLYHYAKNGIQYTKNGNYAIILIGCYNIWVFDTCRKITFESKVQLFRYTWCTRCCIVSNEYQDQLLVIGFIRFINESFPDDLVSIINQYYENEYLHVMDTDEHQKISLDDVLQPNE